MSMAAVPPNRAMFTASIVILPHGSLRRPPIAAAPGPPVSLRAISAAPAQVMEVTELSNEAVMPRSISDQMRTVAPVGQWMPAMLSTDLE